MPWLILLVAAGAWFVRSYVLGFAGGAKGTPDFEHHLAARAALERDAYLRGGTGPDRLAVVVHRTRDRGSYDALAARYTSVDEAEAHIRAQGGAPRTADDAETGISYHVFDVSQPIQIDPPTQPILTLFMSN